MPKNYASFCEGCPKSDVFERVNNAAESPDPVLQKAGELGIGLLSIVDQNGPSNISTPGSNPTSFCCKQALIGLAGDTVKRTKHAELKNKLDN